MSNTKDAGKIRMGAGCRIVPAKSTRTADAGTIKMGAGCRILKS